MAEKINKPANLIHRLGLGNQIEVQVKKRSSSFNRNTYKKNTLYSTNMDQLSHQNSSSFSKGIQFVENMNVE